MLAYVSLAKDFMETHDVEGNVALLMFFPVVVWLALEFVVSVWNVLRS